MVCFCCSLLLTFCGYFMSGLEVIKLEYILKLKIKRNNLDAGPSLVLVFLLVWQSQNAILVVLTCILFLSTLWLDKRILN